MQAIANPLNLGNSISEDVMNFFNEEKYAGWKKKNYKVKKSVVEQFETVTNKPNIVIVADYDVDGIMGAYEAVSLVQRLHPEANVSFINPRRFTDGYGVSEAITEAILKEYTPKDTCIMTVDNGISQFKALNRLYEAGFSICLTDHHIPQKNEDGTYNLPLADLIINPHILDEKHKDDFAFEHYCGAGVIYKLAKELLPAEEVRQDFLPYAAIATIADVMPLIEENWVMVHEFLENADKYLPWFLNFTNKKPGYIDEEDVGFSICPVLNAAGRLLDDGASLVVNYLFNPTELGMAQLKELNEQRKQLSKEQTEIVMEYIKEHHLEEHEPICVDIPGLHHGIVGIIAGRVTETFNRACMICSDGKGSGRAPIGFDIYQFCKAHETLFKEKVSDDGTISYTYGGHEGACGFSISPENFQKLAEYSKKIERTKEKQFDVILNRNQITEFHRKTSPYRPFGEGNPAPRCLVSIRPEDESEITYLGKTPDKKPNPIHLSVKNSDGSKIVHFYHRDPETMKSGLTDDNCFDGIGKVGINYFENYQGKVSVTAQLTIEEVYEPEEQPRDLRRW